VRKELHTSTTQSTDATDNNKSRVGMRSLKANEAIATSWDDLLLTAPRTINDTNNPIVSHPVKIGTIDEHPSAFHPSPKRARATVSTIINNINPTSNTGTSTLDQLFSDTFTSSSQSIMGSGSAHESGSKPVVTFPASLKFTSTQNNAV